MCAVSTRRYWYQAASLESRCRRFCSRPRSLSIFWFFASRRMSDSMASGTFGGRFPLGGRDGSESITATSVARG